MFHVTDYSTGWWETPSTNLGSSGPTRVHTAYEPDPTVRVRPVGFTADLTPTEHDPVLWEGDQA